jgi:hypothetical protein
MSKSDRYSAKESNNELEDIASRLGSELRAKIRTLGNHPLYSEQWCDMAEIFGRIASISDIEQSLSAAKGDGDGTLWETEEQALRYLIEDGKLNLCLRQMIEFKRQQKLNEMDGKIQTAYIAKKCDEFEKGNRLLV